MNLFSYVITHDTGFAPNPFGRFLSLATCKPRIRRKALKGDFIVGTGSSTTVGNQKLVYAAQVADVVPLDDYGKLPKYEIKQPSTRGEWWKKHGDNIYFMLDDQWKQRRNLYHRIDDLERDVGGKNALICSLFWYFGEDAIDIPLQLQGIIKKGPGHKQNFDYGLRKDFIDWLTQLPEGRHGNPAHASGDRCN